MVPSGPSGPLMYPNVHFERRTSAPGSASTKRNYQFWAASTSSSARIASYSCPLPFARVLGGGGMKRKNALRPIENGPIGTQWPPNVPQRPFRVQNIRTRICRRCTMPQSQWPPNVSHPLQGLPQAGSVQRPPPTQPKPRNPPTLHTPTHPHPNNATQTSKPSNRMGPK